MVYGIGTDIIEVDRIRSAVGRWGDRFLRRIFTEDEISYCFRKSDPSPCLAARFAAKEALIKAMTPDYRLRNLERGLKIPGFTDIEVLNQPTGKPFICLKDNFCTGPLEGKSLVIHLTMSHEQKYATATVILETKEK